MYSVVNHYLWQIKCLQISTLNSYNILWAWFGGNKYHQTMPAVSYNIYTSLVLLIFCIAPRVSLMAPFVVTSRLASRLRSSWHWSPPPSEDWSELYTCGERGGREGEEGGGKEGEDGGREKDERKDRVGRRNKHYCVYSSGTPLEGHHKNKDTSLSFRSCKFKNTSSIYAIFLLSHRCMDYIAMCTLYKPSIQTVEHLANNMESFFCPIGVHVLAMCTQ